jgi:predicted outer membrane lipoprotein
MTPFASWGRVSTEDRQDPESSRAWQRARAKALIDPHGGQIVAEFFDLDKQAPGLRAALRRDGELHQVRRLGNSRPPWSQFTTLAVGFAVIQVFTVEFVEDGARNAEV